MHSKFKELSNEYSQAQIRVKTKKLWPRQVGEEKQLLSGKYVATRKNVATYVTTRKDVVTYVATRIDVATRFDVATCVATIFDVATCVATRNAAETLKRSKIEFLT